MFTEFLQFGAMLAVFVIIAAVWLVVVYLPRRTMEDWKSYPRARRESEKREKQRDRSANRERENS